MRHFYIIIICLLYSSSALPNIKILSDTTNSYDQQQNNSVYDSSEFQADTLSIEESFTTILIQLQSLITDQEYIIKSYRKVVIGLLIIVSFLVIVVIISFKRRFFFPHFPFYKQKKGFQSGLVCLQMISKYYGKKISYKRIRKASNIHGTVNVLSVNDLIDTAKNIGFHMKVIKADIDVLISGAYLPLILYLPNHMVILHKITNDFVYIADPFYGFLKLKIFYFLSTWYATNRNQSGIALLIRPSLDFKGRTRRILKTQSIDFSEIQQLERTFWKNIKCEI
jgi:hypothetical protein